MMRTLHVEEQSHFHLKAQGLASLPGFDRLVDESAGFGGPILKDRLWFYYAERYRDNDIADVNVYYSVNPLQTTYNPSGAAASGWL